MHRRSFLKGLLAGAATLEFARGAAPVREAGSRPLCLHPSNPHYFLFRERPALLVTSGEHYGAVLNLDFDYVRYLDVLQAHGFNLTRTFSGTYREVPGSFGIQGNTLAPAPSRYVCPWPRSSSPGAADGGNRFDLSRWDTAYFDRLKDFVEHASRRGIVVELVLFCTMYDDALWNVCPMNARNNVQGIGKVGRHEVFDAKHEDLLKVQRSVARKLVTELNAFDNVYFEICNEPYERAGQTQLWHDVIIDTIVATEESLPKRHLIAQNFPSSTRPIEALNPRVSVLNFHAASADTVRLNYSLNRPIAFDETGGSDRSDRKYRTEAWDFIIAGGSVFSHLDFSFTPDHEDGTAFPLPPGIPGGGGPELRQQLGVLKRFIESLEFIRMAPDHSVIRGVEEVRSVPLDRERRDGPRARALSEPGKAYAIYLRGGTQSKLALELPAGRYAAEWIETKRGGVASVEVFEHLGGVRTFGSPEYSDDIALQLGSLGAANRVPARQ